MKILKEYINNLGIREKILYACIPLIVFPVVLCLLLMGYLYSGVFLNREKENIKAQSELIAEQISDMRNMADKCSVMLNININYVLHMTKDEVNSEVKGVRERTAIYNQLELAGELFEDISVIVYMDRKGQVLRTDSDRMERVDRAVLDGIFDLDTENSRFTRWYEMTSKDLLTGENRKPYICLARRLVGIDSQDNIGILLIYIEEETLRKIYPGEHTYISEGGRIISAKDPDRLFTVPAFWPPGQSDREVKEEVYFLHKKTDAGQFLFSFYPIKNTDMGIIMETDLRYTQSENSKIFFYIMAISLAAMLVSTILSAYLSKNILTPLFRLRTNIKRFGKGEPLTFEDNVRKDEIGDLSRTFEKMAGRINGLIQDIQAEQEEKRKMELSLLHTQIKPHFLYNSLDLIYVLSTMGKNHEAGVSTKALADFYRYSLSDGKDIITIREEVRIAVSYLIIQKNRYFDVLDFKTDIDENCEDVLIPKLTIQPLLENAIYHGIKPQKEKGCVSLKIYKEKEYIFIEVKDDGIGADLSEVENIINGQFEKHPESFGLYGVCKRLRLYFGSDFSVEAADNSPGFIIRLRISNKKML